MLVITVYCDVADLFIYGPNGTNIHLSKSGAYVCDLLVSNETLNKYMIPARECY
jgi:hypothetical protein